MNSKRKKINIVILVINLLALLIFGILFGIISSLKKEYSSDNAKRLWDNDKYTYSQVSLYLSPRSGLDVTGVYSLRSSIENKLKENTSSDKKNDLSNESAGRLWIDSSSTQASLTVKGGMGSCDAEATGTWGDYFIFHPEDILYGSYYSDDDINFDRIILDKNCSWQIFGAVETVGMPVEIGNKVFYVAAVVDTPSKQRDKDAYGIKPRVYMPLQAMQQLSDSTVITSYEVCIPNFVKDYAYNTVKELNTADEKSSVVIDQSGRFDLIKLFTEFDKIPQSVMVTADLSYPWYENRTRGAEIIAKVLAGSAVYILILPAVSSVYGIFLLTKLVGRQVRAIKNKAEEKYQKKISEAYYQKQKNK